jgi:hypothetical protein
MTDSEKAQLLEKDKEKYKDPIKALIEHGKENGFLTYEEINRRLPETMIHGEELDELFGTLEDLGVEVVDRQVDLLRPLEKPVEEEVPVPDIVADQEWEQLREERQKAGYCA